MDVSNDNTDIVIIDTVTIQLFVALHIIIIMPNVAAK